MLFFSCILAAFRRRAGAPAFQKERAQLLLPVLGCPEFRRWCPLMNVDNCDLAWRVALGFIGSSDHKVVKDFVLHSLWKIPSQGRITNHNVSRASYTQVTFSTTCGAGYERDPAEAAAFRRTRAISSLYCLTAPKMQMSGRVILHVEKSVHF